MSLIAANLGMEFSGLETVYQFNHVGVCTDQSESTCQTIFERFQTFFNSSDYLKDYFTQIDGIKIALEQMKMLVESKSLKWYWYPEYGCSLMIQRDVSGTTSISLIA